MAIFEKTIRNQNFDTLLRKLERAIPDSSWSAELEAGSDFKDGSARCSVRVFERYSMVGGNRLSLTLTLFQNGDEPIRLSAIAAGGSQAVFFKMNTLGEDAFLEVLGMILFTVVSNLRTWSKNNASPRLAVPATVVAKRMNVSRHHTANAGDMTGAHGYTSTSATTYYVTFQVESGDRMELEVDGSDYGMLVEGDTGRLSFQGTRYLGFERKDE